MAKKNRNAERRATIEKMRREQQRKERIRTWSVLGVCLVIVAGLLAVAVREYIASRPKALPPLAQIGVSASTAGCKPVKTKPADGNQDHVQPPTPVRYADAPPAFGKHWANFLTGSEIKTFYTRSDTPEIERLVHSLEHGYTILWYDDNVKTSSKDYQALKDIGAKLDVSDKLLIAPYITKDDGGTFPQGTDFALTHWTGPTKQLGAWQYCSGVSGAAVQDFMKKYPKDDAPEPGGI